MQQLISSSRSSDNLLSMAAAEGAHTLVKLCRLRKDISDVPMFVTAIAYVLNHYPPEVIDYVTDPARGLPSTLKFPLEIADVERACKSRVFELAMSRPVVRPFGAPPPSSRPGEFQRPP